MVGTDQWWVWTSGGYGPVVGTDQWWVRTSGGYGPVVGTDQWSNLANVAVVRSRARQTVMAGGSSLAVGALCRSLLDSGCTS